MAVPGEKTTGKLRRLLLTPDAAVITDGATADEVYPLELWRLAETLFYPVELRSDGSYIFANLLHFFPEHGERFMRTVLADETHFHFWHDDLRIIMINTIDCTIGWIFKRDGPDTAMALDHATAMRDPFRDRVARIEYIELPQQSRVLRQASGE